VSKIPKGHRVWVSGGFYKGARGRTLSAGSALDKVQVHLDSPPIVVWIHAYLLDDLAAHDRPAGVPDPEQ